MSPAPRLSDVVAAVRRHATRRLWSAAAPWAGVVVAAVLLAAWLLAGGGAAHGASAAPLLLDALLLVALAGGVVALRRLQVRRLSDGPLAGEMEAAAGLPRGAVLGRLELSRTVPPGVSAPLAEAAERAVVRDLELDEERLAGGLARSARRWRRSGWAALAALVPLVVAAAALSPERSAAAWRGLGSPLERLAGPELPPLSVAPGDAEVSRGDDVEVSVEAPLRDSVTLRWQATGDVPRSRTAPVREGRASFTVAEVRAPVRYAVTTPDGARAGDFTLTPVDPLFVADVTVELRFPGYVGRTPETYRGDVPPLLVPAGTGVEVRGRASRPLGEGALVDSAGRAVVDFAVDSTAFEGSWRPTVGGRYPWRFTDAEGEPAAVAPTPLELTVVPDSAPSVRFTFPARDTVLPLNRRQPLVLEATDDHGLAALELVAWRVTSPGDADEPRVQAMQVRGSRAVLARPVLDLSGWDLLPGDTVRYYARTRDNAPDAATARSREYVLRMPGADEMRRDAGSRLDETALRVEELAERAERSADGTRALERRAAAEGARAPERRGPLRPRPEPGRDRAAFEAREEVRRALEEQAAMEAEVDSLRRGLEAVGEAMTEAGLSDPSLRSDLEELAGLMEEVASEERRARLERLAEELDGMDAAEAREAVEELLERQESFRERLEESLERFRRAAVEQDFRTTTAEAEALAREEEALAEALREGDDPERRAAQQDDLTDRAREAEARMERLEGRLQQLGEQDAAREVREARTRSAESRAAMEAAARKARRGRSADAGSEADRAAGAMDEAGRELREAQQRMAREQVEAMERALRQTADDALALARRQSELQEEMRGAGRERMAEMRADVAAVERGLRSMADAATATGAAQAGGRALSEEIGRAMEAVRGTVEAMDDGGAPAASPARRAGEAVEALNRLALTAMAGARRMSEGGGSAESSGGEGEVQEQLQQLAQQQGSLNNQAGQMMPLQLGRGAMRSQMQRLSEGQRSVAEELDDLAGRPEGDQALGDLDALAEEARALAEALDTDRLEPETRRRQERLFHRLLDAGRSLEKDELSEERESEAAGAVERGEVVPLGPEALRALRYRLPDAETLRRLGPAERRLVIRYFERLNRAGGAEAPPTPPGEGGGG